jgi:hypothetical protein
MTLNFYVSYLVPVRPEKIQKIEQEISRIERKIIGAYLALDASFDRQGADLSLVRLRAQMDPERRREPAITRPGYGGVAVWLCPVCKRDDVSRVVAGVDNGRVETSPRCLRCDAEVHKEELPMSLDLFRMRTRRTDGVEVTKCQPNAQ